MRETEGRAACAVLLRRDLQTQETVIKSGVVNVEVQNKLRQAKPSVNRSSVKLWDSSDLAHNPWLPRW